MKRLILSIFGFLLITIMFIYSCSGPKNSNFEPHFGTGEDDGCLIDTTPAFNIQTPSQVKFYVEVSGSMNGFFRANKPTDFKADLWRILSYYSPISPEVNVLTNDGTQGAVYQHEAFRTRMNTGSFVSTASTKVPLMLQSIIDNLNTEAGEVAVLVSDMKYSPVGAAAPQVLMTHYSTDISNLFGKFGKAVSLICATSNYLDYKGNEVCLRSPYYYLILGNSEQVAGLRNGISTLLENEGHFVDNIETGFDFEKAGYSFGIPRKCIQFNDEPTFTDYEEHEIGIDTCTIKLKVNLEPFRWIMANEERFRKAFKVKTKFGSQIEVGNIEMDIKNITEDKQLNRKVTAMVDLKILNMPTASDVIEWTLELPDTDYSLLQEFFDNAIVENDPSKSYSLIDFVKGMFYGGVLNKTVSPNYILVSKNN